MNIDMNINILQNGVNLIEKRLNTSKWKNVISSDVKSYTGIIETSLSDHQLIFCTWKIKRAEPKKHNYLTFCSMKNFSTEIYDEALGKLTFPDYENFGCVNKAYSDLTSKFFYVVNKMAPTKTIRVKNNTNEWLDGEIAEKKTVRDKL